VQKNTKREIATVLSVLLANKEHKKAGMRLAKGLIEFLAIVQKVDTS
jgi:hypothetical protein